MRENEQVPKRSIFIKRLFPLLLSVCVVVAVSGDGQGLKAQRRSARVRQLESSEIRVGDEAYAPLLLRGFHASEGEWSTRWTARKFAVRLERPAGPEVVYLVLQFALAPEVLKAYPAVTIASRVNGVELGRRSFNKTGGTEYVEAVPEKAFTKRLADVEFEVDHSIPLHQYGNQEGGLMAYSIALRHSWETPFDREKEMVRARQGNQYLLAKRDLVIPQKEQTELLRLFHKVPIWQHMFFQNVAIEKNPLDLWMMQQIIYEVQPDLVIETGTWLGGSALYWAHTLNGMGLERSRVVTIDVQDGCATAQTHPLWKKYVTFLKGSSTDRDIVARVTEMAKGRRTLVTLDSDHSMAHVLRELQAYAPIVSRGSYLVVEDTNLDAVPIAANFVPGPMAAVQRFLDQGGSEMFEKDITREAYIITFNPGGWLRRK